jgi:hypothetical protein
VPSGARSVEELDREDGVELEPVSGSAGLSVRLVEETGASHDPEVAAEERHPE